jgi:hypothetical protein
MLHNDPDLGPSTFAQGPVDGHAGAHLGDEFGDDDLELGIAHHLHRTLVGGEGVVERHLVVVQAKFCPAFSSGVQLLRQLDEFLDDLLGGDGAVGETAICGADTPTLRCRILASWRFPKRPLWPGLEHHWRTLRRPRCKP